MNVNDVVAAKIEAARIRAERQQRRRQELAAARRAGLAKRQARRLFNLAQTTNQTLAASGGI